MKPGIVSLASLRFRFGGFPPDLSCTTFYGSMKKNLRPLQDVNIIGTSPLISPRQLKQEFPTPDSVADHVVNSRAIIEDILRGNDRRIIAIVGPCSIHNTESALEYARRLKPIADSVADRVVVVMRVYFEKPRTTVGWKGLINDPHLNDTFDIETGLRRLARFSSKSIALGCDCDGNAGTHYAPVHRRPDYSGVHRCSHHGIPTHRQMASGLSMPVGFKNSTEGSLEVAINAMKAARAEHCFLGIDHDGKTCVMNTRGNELGHLILRGGRNGPNYHEANLAEASRLLQEAKLPPGLLWTAAMQTQKKTIAASPMCGTMSSSEGRRQ